MNLTESRKTFKRLLNESTFKVDDYVDNINKGMGWVTSDKVDHDLYDLKVPKEEQYEVYLKLADEGLLYNETLINDPESEDIPTRGQMSVEDVDKMYKKLKDISYDLNETKKEEQLNEDSRSSYIDKLFSKAIDYEDSEKIEEILNTWLENIHEVIRVENEKYPEFPTSEEISEHFTSLFREALDNALNTWENRLL